MKKDTMEIVHDLMIIDHVVGVLIGEVFAYNSMVGEAEKSRVSGWAFLDTCPNFINSYFS